jgi:hypothetical protein
MAHTPNTGLQMEAGAPEPDGMADDTVDLDSDAQGESGHVAHSSDEAEHPFTTEQYTAAAELAAETEKADGLEEPAAAEPGAPGDDTEPSPLDALDAKTAAHVQKLRKEAATSRAALQAASTEAASLQEWKQGRMRQDVQNLAGGHKMIQPSEIWHLATMSDFLDPETGDISEAKVAQVVNEKVPSHWKVQPRSDSYARRRGPMSGASGISDTRPTSWTQALNPSER